MEKISAEETLIEFVPKLKLSEKHYARLIAAMGNYASVKCKEQRKIIAKKIKDGYNFDTIPNSNRVNEMVQDDILDAPEPKI